MGGLRKAETTAARREIRTTAAITATTIVKLPALVPLFLSSESADLGAT